MLTAPRTLRIGIIGFGFIGAGIYTALRSGNYPGVEVAFVHNRSEDRLDDVPHALRLDRLEDFAEFKPDLIVECAHPAITVAHGEAFLRVADYMPLSVTALADDTLRERLIEATRGGHRLLLPQGALIGVDSLFSWRAMWRDVSITFRKHPHNIDFALTGRRREDITEETAIYDGPVRGIAPLFPRNVNTMVTCALATVGLDRCRARLVADPTLQHAIAEVEAWGTDGSYLSTTKQQPAVGVSGTEMLASTMRSLLKSTATWQALDFV